MTTTLYAWHGHVDPTGFCSRCIVLMLALLHFLHRAVWRLSCASHHATAMIALVHRLGAAAACQHRRGRFGTPSDQSALCQISRLGSSSDTVSQNATPFILFGTEEQCAATSTRLFMRLCQLTFKILLQIRSSHTDRGQHVVGNCKTIGDVPIFIPACSPV